MNVENYIISDQATIVEAIKKIDQNGKGIVFICEAGMNLKGVVSDGDIRRYILSNQNVENPVSQIAKYQPKRLMIDAHVDSIDFMKKNGITAVPILDRSGSIIRIDFDDYEKIYVKGNLNISVVIIAGGKGTRLYPYTKILPKPLIPIGDKTITEHIIDQFERYGCRDIKMIVNYKKNFIKTYFQDTENPIEIQFYDEKEFLGTGGGLRLVKDDISETFFVSNCDIIVEADYRDILNYHKEKGNVITIVCAQKKIEIPYGTVETNEEGRAVLFSEKPQYSFLTNTGLYVVEPEFIDMIPADSFIHITDTISECMKKNMAVGVYPINEDAWLDMGQIDELERMRRRLNLDTEGSRE